jgi:hypothetical protein
MRTKLRAGAFVLCIAAVACGVAPAEEDTGTSSWAYKIAPVIPEGSSLPSLDLPRPKERGAPVFLPLPGSSLEPIEGIPDHCHEPAEHAFEGDTIADGEIHLPFIDENSSAHIFTVLYDRGYGEGCVRVNDWSSFLYAWVTTNCSHFVTLDGNITAPPFTSGSFHICSDENGTTLTPMLCSDSPALESCKGPAAPPLEPSEPKVTGPNAVANPPADATDLDNRMASRQDA